MCSTNSTLPQFVDLACLDTTPPSGTQIGGEIHDLFRYSLSQKLKHPRIRLLAADGQVVILRLAGSKSRYSGQILITDDGHYPHNLYFGRIDLDGVFYESSIGTATVREQLIDRFASNPREVAFMVRFRAIVVSAMRCFRTPAPLRMGMGKFAPETGACRGMRTGNSEGCETRSISQFL